MIKILSFAILMMLGATAQAADIASIARGVDSGAETQRDGSEVTIVTNAQRVTPHDPPFTTLVEALCQDPSSLDGVQKVIVLNSHAFKGVEFWTYDESDDLRGTCSEIAGGKTAQMYSVMH